MVEKLRDEHDAMLICREKVAQRGLPMQIVDAEYQWDRRKLTFFFKADKRVDFRELTKENFRIFKVSISFVKHPADRPVSNLDVDGPQGRPSSHHLGKTSVPKDVSSVLTSLNIHIPHSSVILLQRKG